SHTAYGAVPCAHRRRARPTTPLALSFLFFFFNDTAPPEISPLSLHDALPILHRLVAFLRHRLRLHDDAGAGLDHGGRRIIRSEEHTSELQSLTNLVYPLP